VRQERSVVLLAIGSIIGAVVAAALYGGVGPAGVGGSRSPAAETPPNGTAEATVPPEPVPVRDGDCPYLRSSSVAETNGQRVAKVRLSADEPHPACFFYSGDGDEEQVRVQVLVGLPPAVATAVVDQAAPRDSSDPATLPGSWQGGKQPTDTGAVFAVAKADAAVVVVTNQKQTIKASRIAEQAITELGL
jgi:UPF0176 protein